MVVGFTRHTTVCVFPARPSPKHLFYIILGRTACQRYCCLFRLETCYAQERRVSTLDCCNLCCCTNLICILFAITELLSPLRRYAWLTWFQRCGLLPQPLSTAGFIFKFHDSTRAPTTVSAPRAGRSTYSPRQTAVERVQFTHHQNGHSSPAAGAEALLAC